MWNASASQLTGGEKLRAETATYQQEGTYCTKGHVALIFYVLRYMHRIVPTLESLVRSATADSYRRVCGLVQADVHTEVPHN